MYLEVSEQVGTAYITSIYLLTYLGPRAMQAVALNVGTARTTKTARLGLRYSEI